MKRADLVVEHRVGPDRNDAIGAHRMAESGIYEILNRVNGKRYVGSAVNVVHRWREHKWALKRGNHGNRHLQASWKRHGEEAFAFSIIELCEPSRLIDREQAAIDGLRPEFNICPVAGSTLGRPHTDEAKAKIGARLRGSKRDPKVVEAIAAQLRGRTRPPEHVACLIGNDHAKGSHHTQEWKNENSRRLAEQYASGTRNRDRPQEYRDKIAATLREVSSSPEVRERLRKQASEAWAARSEEERLSHMAAVRAARGPVTDEQRLAISERQKGRPMHPNAAKALREANVGRTLTEEHRKKIADNNLKSWTPERKARQAAAMRAHHARRKALLTD